MAGCLPFFFFFFFQAEDGIRDLTVTGVQTCALPICGQTEKTLATAGGYTIRVSDNDDTETGTYDVNLVVISDSAHNCAQPIACGDVRMGSLDRKGESDTYRVSGEAGDVVRIETKTVGGMLNACWRVY